MCSRRYAGARTVRHRCRRAPDAIDAHADKRYFSHSSIEFSSVKRRPASSPNVLFLGAPWRVLRWSERSSRCGSACCSRSWMGREGPGACGWYDRADGAHDPTTSRSYVLRQGNSRARRSRFSQLDSRLVGRCLSCALVHGRRQRSNTVRIVRHIVAPHRRATSRSGSRPVGARARPPQCVCRAAVSADFDRRICPAASTKSQRMRPLPAFVIRPS